MKLSFLLSFFFISLLLIIYLPILLFSSVGGDTSYIFPSMFKDFPILPYAWTWSGNNGFGGFVSPYTTSQLLTILISFFGNTVRLNWGIVIKLVFVIPFLAITFTGIYFLSSEVFKPRTLRFLSVFIYLANTYVLMLVAGGQFVVAIAFGLIPLSTYFLVKFIKYPTMRSALIFALVLAFQVMADIRLTYIAVIFWVILFLYFWIQDEFSLRKNLKKIIAFIFFVFLAVLCLQMFWLLPTLLQHESPLSQLGAAYTSNQAVKFFSFAKFENAISLLHPNWPHNIFGLTGFMKPEFLLIPLVAYASLFFLQLKKRFEDRIILLFAAVGIFSAFLAKGTNEPFGQLYIFMFNMFPGFSLFRDSTKWYTLIALSYSFLIPYSIYNFYSLIKASRKMYHTLILPALFCIGVLYLCWIMYPALSWNLPGTFQPHVIPEEYKKFENMSSKDQFYRIMWVPIPSRYSYASSNHPSITALDYYKTSSIETILNQIQKPQEEKKLQEAGVKYIIIPQDADQDIFLKDRRYDMRQRTELIRQLERVGYLHRNGDFHELAVYQITSPKDHFWSSDPSLVISYHQLNPTEYNVSISNAIKGQRLVFNENYSNQWILHNGNIDNKSLPYNMKYNSFVLPKDGKYTIRILYTPQRVVKVGVFISTTILVFLLLFLLKPRLSEKTA